MFPSVPQSNHAQHASLGPGCGQHRQPAVPTARTSAKPGRTGGRVWHGRGCHGDRAGLNREGMQKEAIVWPKWSTPHKEWHFQTVTQAYCCLPTRLRCRLTFHPTALQTGLWHRWTPRTNIFFLKIILGSFNQWISWTGLVQPNRVSLVPTHCLWRLEHHILTCVYMRGLFLARGSPTTQSGSNVLGELQETKVSQTGKRQKCPYVTGRSWQWICKRIIFSRNNHQPVLSIVVDCDNSSLEIWTSHLYITITTLSESL